MNMSISSCIKRVNSIFKLSESGELLFITAKGDSIKVTPSLCFPWMKQAEHISIRDDQGCELHLINNLMDLDEFSQQAVTDALAPATFMLNITHIKEIKNGFELRSWKVITEQGPYWFQTPMDYWPRTLNGKTVLIEDVTGNIFRIRDLDKLDVDSAKILWPFID